jgi:putative ABC transport system permease protein
MTRLVRLLGLRQARQDLRRVTMIVCAIAAGVTLAVTTYIVMVSIDRSVRSFGQGLSGPAALRVEGVTERGGLTDQSLRLIASTDGVHDVVPMVRALSFVDPASSREGATRVIALGVDCRIEALVGDVGCSSDLLESTGAEPVAVGPDVARVGPGATLRSENGRIPVDRAPALDALEQVLGGRVVLFSAPAAQAAFARDGRFDVAYVVPEDDADPDELRSALDDALGGRHAVLEADAPPRGLELFLATVVPLFGILAIFGVGVGMLLVHNVVSLALAQRRQQLAVMLSMGSSRGTLAAPILLEIAVLGLAGGALGAVAGAVLARPIMASLSPLTETTLGMPLSAHVPPAAFLGGVGLGVTAAVATAALAVRTTLSMDVVTTLSGRDETAESRPLRIGRRAAIWVLVSAVGVLGCWAVSRGGGLAAWQVGLGPAAFVVASLGLIMLVGALAPLGATATARVAKRRHASTSTVLALAEFQRSARRVGVMVGAVATAVIVAVVVAGMYRSIRLDVRASEGYPPGVYVSTGEPGDPDIDTSAWQGPDVLRALDELPGVEEVVRGVVLVVGEPGADMALHASDDPQLNHPVLRGTADVDRFEAGQVLVGPGIARRDGIMPGDTLTLPTVTGPVGVPVQGVWDDGRYAGFNVTITMRRLEEIYGPQPAALVTVRPSPGTSEAELSATIRSADLDPTLTALTRGAYVDRRADEVIEQVAPFRVLQFALMVLAFVAVAATLLLAAQQRRREYAVLLALGARSKELGRAYLTQAGIVAGVAIVLAGIAAPVLQWCLQQVLPLIVGFRQPFRPAWGSIVTSGILIMLVTLAAAALPARRSVRVQVAEALRWE